MRKACLIIFLFAGLGFPQNEYSGVNLTVNEGFGARQMALGNTFLGMRGDGTYLATHPAGLNDAEQTEITLGHTRKFILSSYDDLSVVIPIHELNTMAFGISRFGGESEARTDPNIEGPGINVSDYLFVSAFAKRWHQLDVGINLSLLYREIDQKGFGMQSDISAQYTVGEIFLFSGLYQGLIPSTTRWESEHWEYQPPDLFLGTGIILPSRYFYGEFNLAFQTEGLFQKDAKSAAVSQGGRIHQSPGDVFLNGNFGLEYTSMSGIALRFGMGEFRSTFFRTSPSFGLSYNYHNLITLDYSFTSHVELDGSHRISISADPFLGRATVFPRRQRILKKLRKARPPAYSGEKKPSENKPIPSAQPDAPEPEDVMEQIEPANPPPVNMTPPGENTGKSELNRTDPAEDEPPPAEIPENEEDESEEEEVLEEMEPEILE